MLLVILCKEWGNIFEGTCFWLPLAFLSQVFPEVFQLFADPSHWLYFQLADAPDDRERMKHIWGLVSFALPPTPRFPTTLGHGQNHKVRKTNKTSENPEWMSQNVCFTDFKKKASEQL